ncbi:hypothetical protein KC19_2G130900 [Ceratodon purpureus]|uniref:Legume lectin domain-containing protein n=1 Tax=Ceratodon purpureus TaxID=3225 RepID=A0A8T0IVV6_CERPU|nr:hypothetical protein KC19_2G130900 [Ceratodon purpureus]KAG0586957.1 hypothetical protein KC19_2G130900 [Ceratodon purpureus]
MGTLQLLHVLVLIIHMLLVEAQNNGGGTTFTYPPFNATSNLSLGGDSEFNEDLVYGTSQVYLNIGNQASLTTSGTCASLLYSKPLQLLGNNNNSSSFSTFFTFSITGTNTAGFAFVLLPQNHTLGIPGGKLCLMPRALDPTSSKFFAVEFDTFKNPEFNDPSNNHVGVNVNSMNSSVTYNLCGQGVEDCSYLAFDYLSNIVQEFTSWVEYDGVTKTVAVFLTNGSTLQDISKPASAIIEVPVDLEGVMSEEMFVGFSGSTTDMNSEIKSIVSWSFSTSAGTHTQGMDTINPR